MILNAETYLQWLHRVRERQENPVGEFMFKNIWGPRNSKDRTQAIKAQIQANKPTTKAKALER